MTYNFGIRRNPWLLFGLIVGVLLLLFGFSGTNKVSAAADCDNNAIIYCGASSTSKFIDRVVANDSLNGHHDLVKIYNYYGLPAGDYDRFRLSARPGVAYKDGRIVVDGLTVATNAKSIGRVASAHGTGYFSTTIAGAGTYYGNTVNKTFASDSLPVMALFNDKGVVQFAVINSCGNPIYGTNNVPDADCDMLHQQPVAGKPGTVRFTTDTHATKGAQVIKLVYDFGDGTSFTTTNISQVVEHTYKTSGNFTAKVTTYVSLPGKQTVTIVSVKCKTVVKIELPFYACINLAATNIEGSKYRYKLTATAKIGNGAKITEAAFTFGDGKTQKVSVSGTASTASTTYEYAKDGTYTAFVTLTIALPDGKTASAGGPNCVTKIPVAVPFYSCTQLSGSIIDEAKHSYSFTASANYGNGSVFTSADFDFGDGNSTTGVKPSTTSASTTHTYAAAGTYRITATLHFTVNKVAKSVQCTASVTPTQPPTPECRPGVPQGSALCAPCKYDASVSASDTAKCVQPNLPSTGAGSFVAIFGAAVVAGFFIFRQYTFRRQLSMANDTDAVAQPAEWPVEHHKPAEHHAAKATSHHNVLNHPNYHQPHRFRPRSHRHRRDS